MRLPLTAAVACVIALVLCPSAGAGTSAAGHLRLAIDSTAAGADFAATPSRDQFVILQGSETARLRSLKAANPRLTVLLYKNLSGMVARNEYGFTTAGVSTQDANAHPEWYLLNTSGERFTFNGYPWVWAADVGSASYQQQWAANVLGQLRAQGWDGVFIDDVDPTISHHYDAARVAKYPTDAQYGAATRSAVAFIGPALRAAGKVAIANFGGHWSQFPSVVGDWLQFLDGAMDEHFTKVGGGPGTVDGDAWRAGARRGAVRREPGQGVPRRRPVLRRRSAGGALRLGDDAAGGQRPQPLRRAGRLHERDLVRRIRLPIGDPAGPEQEADAIHRRPFTRGLVLVNPTAQARAVGFGGSYSGSGLASATGAVMEPRTGLILVRDQGPPATAPVATAPTTTSRRVRRCTVRRAAPSKARRSRPSKARRGRPSKARRGRPSKAPRRGARRR